MKNHEKKSRHLKKPDWIRKRLFFDSQEDSVKTVLQQGSVHTVCQEARCPNLGECFSSKTATFLLLGTVCTRNCTFCNISGQQGSLLYDKDEPARVAETVRQMGLRYVVLTSVTRDDLEDGGATIFVETVRLIKKEDNGIEIEVLVPDFRGNRESIRVVAESGISVFNHNLETVPDLYSAVRPEADYSMSLSILSEVKKSYPNITVKTGIMVGLGETRQQVLELMDDVAKSGIDILTIGQYLPPGKEYYPVQEYVTPEQFDEYRLKGLEAGIAEVISGPLVRSSYLAEKSYKGLNSD
jgi:lipoic acid synthetase